MKRIVFVLALLLCLFSVSMAELGPVVVKSGRYRKMFKDKGYCDVHDSFTVAMVEGGEWEIYASISSEKDVKKTDRMEWEIVDKKGNVIDSQKADGRYGSFLLPNTLEVGKEYVLRLTCGELKEELSFNVISEKKAALNRSKDLDIIGIEEGGKAIPRKFGNFDDLYFIDFEIKEAGFERIYITITDENTNRVVWKTDDNCNVDDNKKTNKSSHSISYKELTPGTKYILTVKQGEREVSRHFTMEKAIGYNPGMVEDGSLSDNAKSLREQNIPSAEKDAQMIKMLKRSSDSMSFNLNKKKNIEKKTEEGKIYKTIHYRSYEIESDEAISPAIIDTYTNREVSQDTVNLATILKEDMQFLFENTGLTDAEVRLYPDYIYQMKGTLGKESADFAFIPFIFVRDNTVVNNKVYVYCLSQQGGNQRAGGNKYTRYTKGYLITDEVGFVDSYIQFLYGFSASSKADAAIFAYLRYSKNTEKLLQAAISADELMNMKMAIGSVTIRRDSDVNVRVKPEVDAEIVGKAKKGMKYSLFSVEENGWFEIELEDGTHGYIGDRHATQTR